MNEDVFWQLIEECSPSTPDPEGDQLAAALTARLAKGPVADVVGFAEQLSWALYRLDRQEYGDGLSGDAFLYTRAAVVAAGREEYANVLRDAERFAPFVNDLVWAEALIYVPDNAYKHLTGEEWNRSTRYSYESYSNAAGWTNA
ncbi:DUF4240 domain-containing protein [Streptomyces sp. NBC_01619]|uniref:DUF4240 domain-containing protein n=1 Tax=Streptomyces pratisoli TaxID=3139917 RepID=A0ACC6QUR1_9ACTN|nr:DUF4240 domain-containing protein [Streptomyces sp. NBC_01619]MCX4515588.1 DUF4240 domain-containing protein [Streptomyces sp. NBC_01619]